MKRISLPMLRKAIETGRTISVATPGSKPDDTYIVTFGNDLFPFRFVDCRKCGRGTTIRPTAANLCPAWRYAPKTTVSYQKPCHHVTDVLSPAAIKYLATL